MLPHLGKKSVCFGIILLYTVKICHCDWFNKEAHWPIAEQDKVRQESKTGNAGRKTGGAESLEQKQDRPY